MKKIISVFLSVVLLLGCFALSVSAEEQLLERDMEIELIVSIDAYTNIHSGSVRFVYNPAFFEIVSGTWLVSDTMIKNFKPDEAIGVYAQKAPSEVEGDVFKLVLRVKEGASLESTAVSATVKLKNNTTKEEFVIERTFDFSIVACVHNFGDALVYDESAHWLACTKCEGSVEGGKKDVAAHSYDNDCDTTCNDCGYVRTITHSFSNTWSKDAANHWHECGVCGEKADVATHTFETVGNRKKCTQCGILVAGGANAVLGDINGDSSVTILDIMACVDAAAGVELNPEIYPGNPDVIVDGSVTVLDIMEIVDIAAGKIVG